jgi:hypothetical protein
VIAVERFTQVIVAQQTPDWREAPRAGTLRRVVDVGRNDLSAGEIELLIDGLSDDVSFDWALIRLGLRGNPPLDEWPPSAETIGAAFAHFERLLARHLVRLGRIEYVDPNQAPGTVAPVKHTPEHLSDVRHRVEQACSTATGWGDWAFSCWLVNTDAGNAVARRTLRDRA